MDAIKIPTHINGDRIVLRRHDVALASKMFTYVDRDRERLQRFLPWVEIVKSIADEEAYIQKTLADWEAGILYDYGMFLNDNDEYLGNVGVHSISVKNRHCEIGYWILGAFEGEGYISEAVSALERAMFGAGFHRIAICCDPVNVRSARVPVRLGYRYEGIRAENLRVGEKFRDLFVFSKTRSKTQVADATTQSPLGLQIAESRIYVSDLKAAATWFEQFLGARPDLSLEGFVRFRLGTDSTLALAPADDKSPTSLGGSTPYMRVLDLSAAIRHAEKQGAKIYRGPLATEYGEGIAQILAPIGVVIGLLGPMS